MIKKIVIPLLLLIGLVVGLVLVKNSQYLGRKATGEKVNVMFSPSINLDNVGIGSTFRLKVIGSVSGGPGFGVMNVGLKYDKSKLELMRNQDDEIEVRLNSKFRGDGTFRQVTNIPGETFNILEILATIAQTRPQITGGEIGAGDPLIDVKFKVLALGQAEVGFASGDDYIITGVMATGGSVNYDLVKTGGGEAKETLTLGAGPTNTSAPPTATGVPPTSRPSVTLTQAPVATPTDDPKLVNTIDCLQFKGLKRSISAKLGELYVSCNKGSELVLTTLLNGENSGWVNGEYYSQLIEVEPNSKYRLSYEVMTQGLNPEGENLAKVMGVPVVSMYSGLVKETDGIAENRLETGFGVATTYSIVGNNSWKSNSYEVLTSVSAKEETDDSVVKYIRIRFPMGLQGGASGQVRYRNVKIEMVNDLNCKSNAECGWCGDVCKKKVPGEECMAIAPPSGYDCVCGSSYTCVAKLKTDIGETPIPTAKITPEAEVTAVATIGQTKTISFEVVLAGVKDYSKCLGENKVDVVLLKDKLRKEYKGVSLTDTGKKSTKNEKIFLVDKLNIADFGESTEVAVFVKGPRHMQMKFGVNGQDDVYNKSGGELTMDNSRVFDFSKYPILAGDVNRDGLVDGVDFVEVKKRASAFEQVEEGQYNSYDLDGSCVVNNQDVVLLVQALNEKYDQMY